jgi:hypothetical protein
LRYDDLVCSSSGVSCLTGSFYTEGLLEVDPGFVNGSSGDFHLSSNSSLIDAGLDDALNTPLGKVGVDADGGVRVVDGDEDGRAVVDVGAFEFNPDRAPVITGFSVSPSNGTAPLSVVFDVDAYDPDGDSLSYVFDLGNGSSVSSSSPSTGYVFSSPGVYDVSVRVSDGVKGVVSSPVRVFVGDVKQSGNFTVSTSYSKITGVSVVSPECSVPSGEKVAGGGELVFSVSLPAGFVSDNVSVSLPEGTVVDRVYKCVRGELVDVSDVVSVNGSRVVLHVVDNGFFDEDLSRGVVEDPLIVTVSSKSSSASKVGGCSVSSGDVPFYVELVNLLVVVAGLGGVMMRRKAG